MPAEAGIQFFGRWIPAFAGTSGEGKKRPRREAGVLKDFIETAGGEIPSQMLSTDRNRNTPTD